MAAIESRTITLKNGQQACIRTPVAEDTPAAIAYLKAVFADDTFFLSTAEEAEEWQTAEKEQQTIQDYYDDPNKLMVVTVIGENVVSMSDVDTGSRKRRQHTGQIGISILPEYRRMGLGTAIMQAMIDWAAAHPEIEKLALGVWSRNTPAIGLYQKMDFVEEGRKVRDVKYADGYYDDCILMAKML